MIASEFIYDQVISGLTLAAPVYLGPSASPETSYISMMDVGNVANPAYLRDTYTVDFIGRYEKLDYQDAFSDFQIIKDSLLGRGNIVDVDGNDWCRFIMTRGPQFVGSDELGRSVITMIFEFVVDKAPDGSFRQSIQ